MYALISPNEKQGNLYRVAEVAKEPFDVALPLFWVEAPQEVSPSTHLFSPDSATFVLHEATPEEVPTQSKEDWRATTEVSRFQARVALYNFGLLDAVNKMMVDPATPFIAKEAWESASVFKRNSPTVTALGVGLNITEDQIDELFKAALEIQA
jgi:hypothetical protein